MSRTQKAMVWILDIIIPVWVLISVPLTNWEIYGQKWIGIPVFICAALIFFSALDRVRDGRFYVKSDEVL